MDPAGRSVPECALHGQLYRYFDATCDCLICPDCHALNHRGHACQLLADAAANFAAQGEELACRGDRLARECEAGAGTIRAAMAELCTVVGREKDHVRAYFAEVGLVTLTRTLPRQDISHAPSGHTPSPSGRRHLALILSLFSVVFILPLTPNPSFFYIYGSVSLSSSISTLFFFLFHAWCASVWLSAL